MPTISIYVDEDLFNQVSALAEQLDRSKSWVVTDALRPYVERHLQSASWWDETLRRCDEAERHPERLQDPETFFRGVRDAIAAAKKATTR